jgi:hypothetical protein
MASKKTFIFLFILSLFGFPLLSQENANVSGGTFNGLGGNVSYSIGQVIYTNSIGSTGSVSQGVQQPYEIYTSSGINDISGITLLMSVFPNPVIDELILKLEAELSNELTYNIYDEVGKLLISSPIRTSTTSISMSQFTPAVYVLKVVSKNNDLKTFKIIKN